MSKVDITLSIIILVGAYSGFRDGFLLELFSLLSILLGVLFGFKFMGWAMVALEDRFHIDEKALPYIAFGTVFFILLFSVNLMARFLMNKLDKTFLGPADQIAGALLGLIRTAFMISVLLWIFDSMKLHFPDGWADDSWILPLVADIAPQTANGIGYILPFFRDVF